ncbi:MAG TPA: hypothetical protein VJN91_06105, partial [Gammaproteobacteria bacterium]|nr:hypothetical protein [Gammaproteobacteria bacterium]
GRVILMHHQNVPAYIARENIRRCFEFRRVSDSGCYRASILEPPTSACYDCGALVRPEELYVGKQSGWALCEACLGIWVDAGRAKQGAEF